MIPARWLVLASHVPADGGLGGMTRYAVEVVRALDARPDVIVHVYCRAETATFFRDDLGLERAQVHAEASSSTIRNAVHESWRIPGSASGASPHVIVGTKHLVPRHSGGAVRVLAVHDTVPFDRPGDFGLAKRVMLPRQYARSIDRAEVLACVSGAARDQVVRHLPDCEPRTVVVPNALTPQLHSLEPKHIESLAGDPFALVVGDQSRRKNLGFLIDLWPQVVERVPKARLALVGPPGWGRNEVIPEAGSLISAGVVCQLGRVDDGELRWAYETAAVTLAPSLMEGFGLPVLEAHSFGCPTVISDDPAQVEAGADLSTVVSLEKPDEWVEEIVESLLRPRRFEPSKRVRIWSDVADDLVRAVAGLHRS